MVKNTFLYLQIALHKKLNHLLKVKNKNSLNILKDIIFKHK